MFTTDTTSFHTRSTDICDRSTTLRSYLINHYITIVCLLNSRHRVGSVSVPTRAPAHPRSSRAQHRSASSFAVPPPLHHHQRRRWQAEVREVHRAGDTNAAWVANFLILLIDCPTLRTPPICRHLVCEHFLLISTPNSTRPQVSSMEAAVRSSLLSFASSPSSSVSVLFIFGISFSPNLMLANF